MKPVRARLRHAIGGYIYHWYRMQWWGLDPTKYNLAIYRDAVREARLDHYEQVTFCRIVRRYRHKLEGKP